MCRELREGGGTGQPPGPGYGRSETLPFKGKIKTEAQVPQRAREGPQPHVAQDCPPKSKAGQEASGRVCASDPHPWFLAREAQTSAVGQSLSRPLGPDSGTPFGSFPGSTHCN